MTMDAVISESFAVGELMRLMTDPVWRGSGVPRGDGRIVQVLPGMFANDMYLQPLRRWLRRVGYRPVRSTLEMNVGCPQRLSEQIEAELARERSRHPGRIAIIGHSRGGLLARAIAARLGADASTLVLLGSPVGGVLRMKDWGQPSRVASERVSSAGQRVRQWLDPNCDVPFCGCPYPADLRRPLHARTRVVSIYSRDDPIVPAEACPIEGARNVEVGGTHSGLAFNAAVYRVLAEELART
jgi:pimeloyl-ACP methyl ester carboxylesterase